MENTSERELSRREIAYYRQRQRNRVFTAIAQLFAEEAAKGAISKKLIAEILGKDPSQVTRWLSAPSNFELDTISDLLLAMGAEMDHRIVRFSERPVPNYTHPLLLDVADANNSQVSVAVEIKSDDTKFKMTPVAATTSSAELLDPVP